MDDAADVKEKLAQLEKCLSLNEAYADKVKDLINQVDLSIEWNQKQQKRVQETLDDTCGDKRVKGANFVPCEYPYFKDSDGMCPAPSPLSKEIAKSLGGADPLLRCPPKWKMTEIRLLKKAVRESLIENMIQPLQERKSQAASSLMKVTPVSSADDVNDWDMALNEMKAEIKNAWELPDAEIFKGGVQHYSNVDWQAISVGKFGGRRTAEELMGYWMGEMAHDPLRAKPRPWTTEETELLLSHVDPDAHNDWDEVAAAIGERSAFQCFKRFKGTRLGGGGKIWWTEEEDQMLINAVSNPAYTRNGETNWLRLTHVLFPDRNKTQVQGRFERSLDPRITRGKWAVDEDVQLLRTINTYGDQDWENIAAHVEGRMAQQCRNRWVNVLDPRRRSRPFLWSELQRLILGLGIFGRHDFARIALLLPGRNSADVKSRINAIIRYRIDREEAIGEGVDVRTFHLVPKNFDYTRARRKEAWDRFVESMEADEVKMVQPLMLRVGLGFFAISSRGELHESYASVKRSKVHQFGERIALRSGRWVRIAGSPNESDEAKLAEVLRTFVPQTEAYARRCIQETGETLKEELEQEANTEEGDLRKFYESILDERMDEFNDMLDRVLPLEDADYFAYEKIKKKSKKWMLQRGETDDAEEEDQSDSDDEWDEEEEEEEDDESSDDGDDEGGCL